MFRSTYLRAKPEAFRRDLIDRWKTTGHCRRLLCCQSCQPGLLLVLAQALRCPENSYRTSLMTPSY
jgi:hypothetical protein